MATVKINENQLDLTNTTSAINAEVAARESAVSALSSSISAKQDALTAGANIVISGGTISAKDTTYTAGDNIVIGSGNVISAVVSGGTYELPPATASSLGGIKVGSGLSVTSDGTLSTSGGYVLPKATTSSLGGVIVGSGLSIDSSGVLVASGGSVSGDYLPLSGGTMAPASGESEVQIYFDTSAGGWIKSTDNEMETVTDLDFKVSAGSSADIHAAGDIFIESENENNILGSSKVFVSAGGEIEQIANSGGMYLKVGNDSSDNLEIKNEGDGNIEIVADGSGAEINIQTSDGDVNINTGSGSLVYNGGTVLTTNDVSVMTGATSSSAGTSGLVPAPASGNQDKFLKGDGTWATPVTSGGGGADVTYDAAEEQLVITTENTPSIVDLDNLTLGDRLNNVATFVTYFTDSQNNKLAVFVLDAIYRKLSGTSFSTSDTSLIKAYGSAQSALASKDSATYTTDKVFAGVTPSASSYSSFYYARNPGGTEFTTTVNGKVYKSQLPNLYELNEIYMNKTALNAVDPTNTESTNLADWNFDGSATSNAIGYGGGVWAINKNEGLGNRGGDKGVIPVLEIPVVAPNINTIKLDNNVLTVKENAYTRTNLIAGSGLEIEKYVPPYAIDSDTLCLFHFDDSYTDAISGNEPEGYYDGYYSYTSGKFGKAIAVSNTSSSYGFGMFEINSSQDYCFDYWYKFTADTSYVGGLGPIKFVRNSEYVLEVFYNTTSLGTFTMSTSLNTFNHCAVQRRNGNCEVFFNGKKLSIPTTADNWSKGAVSGFGANYGDPIDELRISGVARYDGDFTPLDQPYKLIDPDAETVYEIKNQYKSDAIPDYANGITVGPVTGATWTQVAKDSFVVVRANDPYTADAYLYVSPDNGTTKYVVGWWNNDVNSNVKGSSWSFFVPKGWYFTSYVENPYTAYIYPLKGAQ